MRCCDCEFKSKCDDIQKVLTAFVKCYRREELLNKSRKGIHTDHIQSMSDEELEVDDTANCIIRLIKDLLRICDFELIERIQIRHKPTGREYR